MMQDNNRRTPKVSTFEWVASPPQVVRHLAHTELRGTVADVGCGTSNLALALAAAPAVHRVLAIDRDAGCIEHMRKTSPHPKLEYRALDLLALGRHRANLAGALDCVVDKGMLDCAVVEGCAAPYLRAIEAMLAPGGVFAAVSFREERLVSRLLGSGDLAWTVCRCIELEAEDGGPRQGLLCVVHKWERAPATRTTDKDNLEQHILDVLDTWYTEEQPYLTSEREAAIRQCWFERSSGGEAGAAPPALPVQAAYEVLLTADERTEVRFDDFVDDLGRYLATSSRDVEARMGFGAFDAEKRLELGVGLAFLRAWQ